MDYNYLDYTSFFIHNIGGSFATLVIGLFIILVYIAGCESEDTPISKKVVFIVCLFFLFFALLWMIPTHDKVLELKISKIKNEAITKENINKSVDKFTEVIEKLECKYLDCKEKDLGGE